MRIVDILQRCSSLQWHYISEVKILKIQIRRGDIYYAQLDPVCGSEQGGTRPVLIVSNNKGNRFGPTVIVVPMTSRRNQQKKFPTHVRISRTAGLNRNSIILFEQIRAIDKCRLREYIGTLDRRQLLSVERALRVSVGIRTCC